MDPVFGRRAVADAIALGDSVIPFIRSESKNYTALNGRNSVWIAEVLGEIHSVPAQQELLDLYSSDVELSMLVGAAGLARRGDYFHSLSDCPQLVRIVRGASSSSEMRLATIAIGWIRDEEGVAVLLELLARRGVNYDVHAKACEALARIGSPSAIPDLRVCLESEDYFALAEAYLALVELGDEDCTALAISRVSPDLEGLRSGQIIPALQTVTGQSFGYDAELWKGWLRSQ